MDYIEEIFARLDLQHIREFLMHGVECVEVDRKTYRQRADEPLTATVTMIQDKIPDVDEHEKITGQVYGCVSAAENVYMEIGMRCGAVLAMQLLANPQRE